VNATTLATLTSLHYVSTLLFTVVSERIADDVHITIYPDWYGTDSDAFIAHLWDYWYSFNRTIWVTEWACHNFVDHGKQCTPEDVVEFMNKTQSFMDNAIFVERYSWFGAMRDMSGVNPVRGLCHMYDTSF
jgi:hypothetical protein